MNLNGEKFEQINGILGKHFKDPHEWERIIKYTTGRTLHEIVGSNLPLEQAIYKSIEKAESEDWLDQLLQKASQKRPHAEDIKEFMESVAIPVQQENSQAHIVSPPPPSESPPPDPAIVTSLSSQIKSRLPPFHAYWKPLLLFLVLIILLAALLSAFFYWRATNQTDTGITSIDKIPVGLCDGSCAFDTARMDGHVKQEAQEAFEQGDHDKGCAYLELAKEIDSADAEAAIYYEDQCMTNVPGNYIGLIVAVPLAGGNSSDIQQGRDILQGIYVQQEEYNRSLPNTSDNKLFLFIANVVSGTKYDTEIQQTATSYISTALSDKRKNILGIIGLPFASMSISSTYADACIPMISVSPLDQNKENIPCFHSIAPSFQAETAAIIKYIQAMVTATQQIVIVNPNGDRYSEQLMSAFNLENKQPTLPQMPYISGDTRSLDNTAQEIANSRPALIYFTGSADDLNIFLHALHALGVYIPVVGSNRCYQYVHIPSRQKSDFEQFAFTSFAYPDQWKFQNHPPLNALVFTTDYDSAFNPDHSHSGNPYSYSRADSDSILGYDELSFLDNTITAIQQNPGTVLSRSSIEQEIERDYANNPKDPGFAGVSGHIAYERDSSIPYDKAVLMLKIWNGDLQSLNGNKNGIVQYGQY